MKTDETRKSYLGDAVYADVNPYGDVILTTEDGVDTTNVIVLEPAVLQALLNYLRDRGHIR